MPLTVEQLAARKEGIGGSDAAAACGISPWKTPYALWLEKTGQVEPEDLSKKENVELGNILEDTVAQIYMTRTGRKVRRINKTLIHPRHKWMRANIDRDIVGEDGHLEIKTTGFLKKDKWGEEGTDEIPPYYVAQCQHTMGITGRSFMDAAILAGGFALTVNIYTIMRDDKIIAALMAKEAEFWNCVETMTPPPPVNLDDIKLMYAQDIGTAIQASDRIVELMEELKAKRAEADLLKGDIDDLVMQAQQFMGESAILQCGDDVLATWKSAKASKKLDVKALTAAHPALVAEFSEEKPGSRRFLVK